MDDYDTLEGISYPHIDNISRLIVRHNDTDLYSADPTEICEQTFLVFDVNNDTVSYYQIALHSIPIFCLDTKPQIIIESVNPIDFSQLSLIYSNIKEEVKQTIKSTNIFELDLQIGRLIVFSNGLTAERFVPGYNYYHTGNMRLITRSIINEAHKESLRRKQLK